MDGRVIVAIGGGGFSDGGPEDLAIDRHLLSLARRPHPRVCFVGTASGDAETYVAKFLDAYAGLDCRPTHLALFGRRVDDLDRFVREQDVVVVGGGSTANLLALWRLHGLDQALIRAWNEGVVLAGVSAGANCWFEQCVTDSFSQGRLDGLPDGLGLLAGSFCPHYDGEPLRRPTELELIGSGDLAPGYAVDDGAALVFAGTDLQEAVGWRPGARAFRVERAGGVAVELPLSVRML